MQAQGKWSAGEGDDKKRFLADLRALRDGTALGFDELAARAHYPSDVLKEAECGPTLPTLPILAAYVRACDGDVPEWEERWRRLALDARADDGLPTRPAGASPAAVAGARAGVSVAPPDAYDPERIRAALRGSHGGRGAAAARVRDVPAEPRVPESPASWSGRTSWDETASWDATRSAEAAAGWDAETAAGWSTGFQPDAGERWDDVAADPSGNGNHHVSLPDDVPSSAAVLDSPEASWAPDAAPDAAPDVSWAPEAAQADAIADAIRRDPFSSAWLQDGELTSPPDTGSGWPDQAEAVPVEAVPAEAALSESLLSGSAPAEAAPSEAAPSEASPSEASPEESWFTPRETSSWPAAETEPAPATAETWFTPSDRNPGDRAPAERDLVPAQEDLAEPLVTGFWTPAASAPSEAPRPAPPPAEDLAVPPASWITPAENPASDPPGPADRTTPLRIQLPATAAATTAVPSRMTAEPAVASRTIAAPAVPPGPVVPPNQPRSDRLYLVRLLVVIVVAALIGSILVLIVR